MKHSSKDLFEHLDELMDGDIPADLIANELRKHYERTRAVLVLDSTGFSRTTNTKGIVHFLLSLRKARRTIRSAIEGCECVRHGFLADNFTAEFETADDALRAARSIQEAISDAQIPLVDDEHFAVTIGIGFGKLLETRNEGVYGPEMNLASKLGEDIGKPGEILLTRSTYLALSEKCGDGLTAKSASISGVDIHYYVL